MFLETGRFEGEQRKFFDAGPLREGSPDYKAEMAQVHSSKPGTCGEFLLYTRDNLQQRATVTRKRYELAIRETQEELVAITELEKDIAMLEATIQALKDDRDKTTKDLSHLEVAQKRAKEELQRFEESLFARFRFHTRNTLQQEYRSAHDAVKAQQQHLIELSRKIIQLIESGEQQQRALEYAKDRRQSAERLQSRLQQDELAIEAELAELTNGESDGYKQTFSQFAEGLTDFDLQDQLLSALEQTQPDPLIREWLSTAPQRTVWTDSKNIETIDLSTQFLDRPPGPEIFFQLLEIYREHLDTLRAEFAQEKEKIVDDFLNAVEDAVTKGWLPVDKDRVVQRVKETTIYLADSITMSTYGHSDLWKIMIASKAPKKDWRHTIFHELVHQAVAGRELHLGIYQQGTLSRPLFQRSGLRKMEYDESGNGMSAHYIGINEAITENIAQRLLKDSDEERGAYIFERGQVQNIVQAEPELEKIMLEAYCEDENPDLPEIEQNSRWNAFITTRDWDREVRSLTF